MRRRRVAWYGCVGSAPASGAPATPKECRRLQTSSNPIIIVIFFQCSRLTVSWLCFAGIRKDQEVAHTARRYGEPEPDLQLLTVGRARVVVPMKAYCYQMPIVSRFHVPGALPQRQKNGSFLVAMIALLAEPAQEVSRAALILLEDLIKTGYCLARINDGTLVVDTSSAVVLLSAEAIQHDIMPISSAADVDSTIACMAIKLEEYLFTQNGLSTSEVPEVVSWLSLMSQSGNEMWHAIINNSTLVPLENKREFYVRMYEQLGVVKDNSKAEYEDILKELVFPQNWHNSVSRKFNGILFVLYSGAVYDATAPTKKAQAEQITRLFRNSGAHLLDRLGLIIGRSDLCLVHYGLAPLLYGSLETALQKRGWLVSTDVHTLFVYARRRR